MLYIMTSKYLNYRKIVNFAKDIIFNKEYKINNNKIIIAGWEASGSTFLYQIAKLLNLEVEKIHGKRSSSSLDFTLFPFRDPRDVICSNAKRVFYKVWQSESPEAALLKGLKEFVKEKYPQALYESSVMPNVILIRYETYFLGNEGMLIDLIADKFLISLDEEKRQSILKTTSIEANINISKQMKSFENWDKDSLIHGKHITNNGKSGNWKQHFTSRVEEKTKDLIGELLINCGYERTHDWTIRDDI